MIRIPEMGRQCYGLRGATFIDRDNVAPSSGMKARAHVKHVLEDATPYQCEENGA